MKAIIMAAGKGTRISRHINDSPKCTVDIGDGKTLIEYTVDNLNKNGINDIVIILGYKGNVVEKILEGKNIKFYYNNFYDVTNSLASLWFAKEELNSKEDIMLMNGDVFFEERFINEIINEKRSPILYSDETRIEEADYRLYYKNEKLIKYGKDLSKEETTGEYIGVAKISSGDSKKILNRMEDLIKQQQHFLWWENALYTLCNEEDIYIQNIAGIFWAEVDYIEDYIRIQEYIKYRDNREKIE